MNTGSRMHTILCTHHLTAMDPLDPEQVLGRLFSFSEEASDE